MLDLNHWINLQRNEYTKNAEKIDPSIFRCETKGNKPGTAQVGAPLKFQISKVS